MKLTKKQLKQLRLKKLEDIKQQIQTKTYKDLIIITGLTYNVIHEYCKQNNLKTKRTRKQYFHPATTERLKILSDIDTSKKTQSQLAKILKFKKNPKQMCSIFIKKHNIKYKISNKNAITNKRLDVLSKINCDEKYIEELSNILWFNGEYYRANTIRFLEKHNIKYK